eukprot:gene8966-biopygen7017
MRRSGPLLQVHYFQFTAVPWHTVSTFQGTRVWDVPPSGGADESLDEVWRCGGSEGMEPRE